MTGILRTDVVIVGAGPVGLITALLLEKVGLSCVVLEQREGLHNMPQAHVISARTMEICRLVGIDETVMRKRGTQMEAVASIRWVATLTQPDLAVYDLTANTDDIIAMLTQSPSPMCNLSQDLFEQILFEKAAAKKGIQVQFNCQWSAAQQNDHGYLSTVKTATNQQLIQSRYVIGADGASSSVRRFMAIEMQGPDSLAGFCTMHFKADLSVLLEQRGALLYWVMDPEFDGVFIAHDIANTWVFMKRFAPGESFASFDRQRCQQLLTGAIGAEIDFELLAISPWVMSAQVAESYAKDNMFLVGDAAHRFPPTGGIGMNTGFQDAHNLVWKLAMCEQGFDRSLLGTYQIERWSVARNNADQSLTNHMKMDDVANAIGINKDVAKTRQNLLSLSGDHERKQQVQMAVNKQAEHFNMRGLDLGFCYNSSAVYPCSELPPVADNPVCHYLPSTVSGVRLPHAWLVCQGKRVSTLDLVSYEQFTLLLFVADDSYNRDNSRINVVPLFDNYIAEDDSFSALFSDVVALLIRPDGHIAWRANELGQGHLVNSVLNKILPDK